MVGFLGIQFFPTTQNESDTVPITDFVLVNTVPKSVKEKLEISCYDCHSNNTQYPWYNKMQPVAWFLKDHIKKGKEELNFNEWTTYSNRRKVSKLRSIIKQIESAEMPLYSYTLVHREAIFSEEDKLMVINYMKSLKDSIE
ncbi:hypothetical protein LCGC14_0118830 [marine sediment metagenome]|uniref:Haem-binding domain-containing protein n=1 Tax=marine sediment metagenome TaxID=412755 RepID=A0A0F9VBB1_9ZZZZ